MNKRDQLDEIMQAAEEIETASDAPLEVCGFKDEAERAAFIKRQAADIVRRSSMLLGYIDAMKYQGQG